MISIRRSSRIEIAGLVLVGLISFPLLASGEGYPDKPITIYCGYPPGATTDATARGLASAAEKLLGVPVVVENKGGGGTAVAAGLVASKKPDGYSLGVITSGALTLRPFLFSVAYDPLKDFTLLIQYSRYIGALCVLTESPITTIDEFIAYAKAHPGLSYGSPAVYSQQQIATEIFAQCKGLQFKHLPTKGGSESYTMLLGKHTDFIAGSGQHIMYVKQGLFRMLVLYNTDKRDPNSPSIPTLKEIGCPDNPAQGYCVVGPKGMPEAISRKLSETFKKATAGPEFQKLLASYDLPYEFKDGTQMEREFHAEYEWYKNYFKKIGVKKEG
jgi:tripartite-type tricarboxylate transporter receptor subunit TctC